MHKKSLQLLLGLLHTLLLVQCQGRGQDRQGRGPRIQSQREQRSSKHGSQRGNWNMMETEREIRRASGFPVNFFDGEENPVEVSSLPNPNHPPNYPEDGNDDHFEGHDQYSPHNQQQQHQYSAEHGDDLGHHPLSRLEDDPSDHDLFDPMLEEDDLGHPGGDAASVLSPPAPAAAAPGPSLKQDENPLNFLNLAGTDFQPGRMVNIFFGLMIMIFMITIHGYILWIVGIAYLPGTRSLVDGWEVDSESVFTLLVTVLDSIQYWNDMQINEQSSLNKESELGLD